MIGNILLTVEWKSRGRRRNDAQLYPREESVSKRRVAMHAGGEKKNEGREEIKDQETRKAGRGD